MIVPVFTWLDRCGPLCLLLVDVDLTFLFPIPLTDAYSRRSLNSSSFNTEEEDGTGTFESFTGDDDDLLNFGILARSNDDDDELDEFAQLGRYKAIGGIVDASDTPIYKVVTKINE